MVWRAASAILLLAVTGWAQAPGDVQQVAPLRSPFLNPLRAAVSPTVPATPESKSKAQKPTATTSKPVTGTAAGAAPSAAPSAIPLVKPTSPGAVKAVRGGRDPFISSVSTAPEAAVCTSGGKRCLMINRIKLKGVVRSESGFIAVVVNAANRAYFLRENDPLMNGYVVRVTSNGVTFKETSRDRIGHSVTRDVTLTMNGPGSAGG
jgi:hypothetical protein